jgi:heme exporter protein B
MTGLFTSIAAVAGKDIRSEVRTRYGITALGLFVITTVSLVVFAIADESVHRPLAAALIWVIMFYTSMTGLGRAFISEEERGTSLFLRLQAPTMAVYFGKLLVNIALALVSNVLAIALIAIFMPSISIGSWTVVLTSVIIGSIGLASVLSIVSAIVAKAGTRNPLLPVLAFPLLVPLIMPGVNAVLAGLAGLSLTESMGDILLMTSYAGLVIVASVFVFDVVWTE